MNDLFRVLEAVETAALWHMTHKRKGKSREPYLMHLLEVAGLVARATEGRDPDLVIAALLHDAVEDRAIPLKTIGIKFGIDVMNLVGAVTDDKALPKDERKRLQVEHAAVADYRVKLLKLSDKISNLRSLAKDPPVEWDANRITGYVDWATHVVNAMDRATLPPWLLNKFEKAATAVLVAVQEKTKEAVP